MYKNGAITRAVRTKNHDFSDVAIIIKGAMEHIAPPLSIWQRIKKRIEMEKEEVSYRLLKT